MSRSSRSRRTRTVPQQACWCVAASVAGLVGATVGGPPLRRCSERVGKVPPGWLGCSSWGGRCATSCGAQFAGLRRTRGATAFCSDRRREVSPRGSLRSRSRKPPPSAPQSPRPASPDGLWGGEGVCGGSGESTVSPGPTRNHAGMICRRSTLLRPTRFAGFLWPSIFSSSRSAREAQAVSREHVGRYGHHVS